MLYSYTGIGARAFGRSRARASRKLFTKLENVPCNQRQIGEPSEVRIISNHVRSSLQDLSCEQGEAPFENSPGGRDAALTSSCGTTLAQGPDWSTGPGRVIFIRTSSQRSGNLGGMAEGGIKQEKVGRGGGVMGMFRFSKIR